MGLNVDVVTGSVARFYCVQYRFWNVVGGTRQTEEVQIRIGGGSGRDEHAEG